MLTAEQIAEFKAANPSAIHITGKRNADGIPRWEVVVRKPKRAEWKRIRSMMHSEAQKPEANEALFRQTVLFPSRENVDALLEEYPAIPESVASNKDLQDAMGLSTDNEEK